MRIIGLTERKKRGCVFCEDIKQKGQKFRCPHKTCPHHCLDGFDDYDQYLTAEGIAFPPGVVLQYIHGKV